MLLCSQVGPRRLGLALANKDVERLASALDAARAEGLANCKEFLLAVSLLAPRQHFQQVARIAKDASAAAASCQCSVRKTQGHGVCGVTCELRWVAEKRRRKRGKGGGGAGGGGRRQPRIDRRHPPAFPCPRRLSAFPHTTRMIPARVQAPGGLELLQRPHERLREGLRGALLGATRHPDGATRDSGGTTREDTQWTFQYPTREDARRTFTCLVSA